jgi:hypothetical protein
MHVANKGRGRRAAEGNPPLRFLASPLGDDTLPFQEGTLHAIGLTATECLSKTFEIEPTVVSTDVLDRSERDSLSAYLRDNVLAWRHGLTIPPGDDGHLLRDRAGRSGGSNPRRLATTYQGTARRDGLHSDPGLTRQADADVKAMAARPGLRQQRENPDSISVR